MTCQSQPAKCEVLCVDICVDIFQVMHHVARVLTPIFRRLSIILHQPTCHTTTTTEITRMTMNTIIRIPEDLQIMSLYI
jgi:hypothetical protein